jgi:hypothetical protein
VTIPCSDRGARWSVSSISWVAEFRERPDAELHHSLHPPMTSPLRWQFWEVPISATKSEPSPRRHAVPCVACRRKASDVKIGQAAERGGRRRPPAEGQAPALVSSSGPPFPVARPVCASIPAVEVRAQVRSEAADARWPCSRSNCLLSARGRSSERRIAISSAVWIWDGE